MTVDMDGARRGSRWRMAAWGGAAGFILLPLLAMLVTEEVNWGVEDFVFATVLVGGVGLAYELAVRTSESVAYRAGVAVALAGAFVLTWMNLAVGVIGSEDNPINLMYFGVLAVGLVGAAVARFRAPGMAHALVAMAVAQVLAFILALVAGFGFTGPITVFFAALWLTSAWLFRKAARQVADGAAG